MSSLEKTQKSKKSFTFDIDDRVKEKSLRINFPDMDGLQQGQILKEPKELKEPTTVIREKIRRKNRIKADRLDFQ